MKITQLINPIYLLIWGALSFYVGINHEIFSDEAQSYLIARDAPLPELFTSICRTEGSPILWYLWLKLLLFMGLDYENLCIASIIPNFLAVSLFIYKSPFPKKITYLLPLTFYFIYQYNVISRSYSLLFLSIIVASIFYKKRKEKAFYYLTSLIFMGSITLYSFVLSSGLFLIYIIENKKQLKQIFPQIMMYGIFSVLTLWYIFPNIDNQYLQDNVKSGHNLVNNLINIIFQGIITSTFDDNLTVFPLIISAFYFGFVVYYLAKEYPLPSLILIAPIVLLMIIVPYHCWHTGILILTTLMVFLMFQKKNKLPTICTKIVIIPFMVHQLISGVYAMTMDISYEYSGSKKLAEYLDKNNISIDEVYLPVYNSLAVRGYYHSKELSYWQWDKMGFIDVETTNKILSKRAFVISEELYKLTSAKIDKIQQENNYQRQKFIGGMFFPYSNIMLPEESLYLYYRSIADEK